MSTTLQIDADRKSETPSPTDTSTPPAPTPTPKKRTPSQASQENGAKSKGPITPEGKRKSSQNARKNMLSAKCWSYSNQFLPGINRIQRSLIAEFKPTTPSEATLVEILALSRWQIQTAAEEIAALVDYTREQFFNDPSRSPRVNSALATDKLEKEGNTLANYRRNQRDAERRFTRALRELAFIRQNTDTLHSASSCIPADRAEELAQIAEEPVDQPEPTPTPENPENTPAQNEPGHVNENIAATEKPTPDFQVLYRDSKPGEPSNPPQNESPSSPDAAIYRDRHDHLTIIHAMNKELLNHPHVHQKVVEAIEKLEDEREARNAELLRRRRP